MKTMAAALEALAEHGNQYGQRGLQQLRDRNKTLRSLKEELDKAGL